MKKTAMTMALVTCLAFVGAADEVRLSRVGAIEIPVLNVSAGVREYLKGWVGTGSPSNEKIVFPDVKEGRIAWTLDWKKKPLGKGATVLRQDGDGAAFVAEVEFGGDRESEGVALTFSLPGDVFGGGTWNLGNKKGSFPEKFVQTVHLGSASGTVAELATADGQCLRLEFPEPISLKLQDSRKWGTDFSLRVGIGKHGVVKGEKRMVRGRIVLGAPCTVAYDQPVVIREEDGWTALDYRKDILAGSALDFSGQGLADAPAGKHGWLRNVDGHFEFENLPGVKQRFYGVNLCSSANFPDHATADTLVLRLKRLGYNSIRVHHYERELVDGKRKGLVSGFDPESADRLDYLLAKAIENGFYITTDVFVSRPVTWTAIGLPERGKGVVRNKNLYKSLVALWEPAFSDWCRFAEMFLLHRNPYTGRRYVDEPALPLISLINEGQHSMGWARAEESAREDPIVRKAWTEWLAKRRAADPKFCPDAPKDAAKVNIYGKDNAAFAQFMADTERASAGRMAAFLRKLGSRALLTNANCGPHFTPMQAVREGCYDYVDDHFYVDHPRFLVKWWQLPSACGNENPVSKLTLPLTRVAFTRMADKPFTVTEWNFSGPGMYRGVGGIMTGVLSALQNWDGLWRFAYTHSRDDLADGAGSPGYFDVGTDPLGQASDRASVCLFLRRDLEAFREAETYRTDAKSLRSEGGRAMSVVPLWEIAAWYKQVSTSVPGAKVRAGTTVRDISETHASETAPFELKENPAFSFDRARGSFRIVTPRTAGGFAHGGSLVCGPVAFALDGAPATVWASSVDAEPTDIANARRIVVSHLTDVQRGGNVYAEPEKKILLEWGKGKTLVRNGSARISLALKAPERYAVWALETTGRRLERIPSEVSDGKLSFVASVKGSDGARMLYEVVQSESQDN